MISKRRRGAAIGVRPKLGKRACGLLLHITSLPGGHGIGDLGEEARRFVDFLVHAGQSWWQCLPLEPTGSDGSPYQALSAFAGNPLLISLKVLARDGWIEKAPAPKTARGLDFARVAFEKRVWFERAWAKFESRARPVQRRAFRAFCDRNAGWLEDYALFAALKEHYGGQSWTLWPTAIRSRKRTELDRKRTELADAIGYHRFLQFQFFRQWAALREYAAGRGIGIIGDIPIFVAHDSAEVWAHPEYFSLERNGELRFSSGVPPDYFSRTGQKWGNPLYRWGILKKTGYAWWVERLKMCLTKYDAVRIDHFIGFQRYWEVPARAPTALEGRWRQGPAGDLFRVMFRRLGKVPLIAEDLGLVTPEVERLRDEFELPGMKVLHFSFGKDPGSRPFYFPRRAVVYTGTHDNNTTVGWLREPEQVRRVRAREEMQAERSRALAYAASTNGEPHWDFIRVAYQTACDLAMVPVQDVLGLEAESRMNTPGRPEGNWRWRLRRGQLTPAHAARLRYLAGTYERGRLE